MLYNILKLIIGVMMNVLIVDDSKLARAIMIKALETEYAELSIFEASNGKEALEKIDEALPDFIFLDLTMPVMNGYELLKILTKEYPDIKVVVVTADIQKIAKTRIMADGAKGYINKPINAEKLHSMIKSINEAF